MNTSKSRDSFASETQGSSPSQDKLLAIVVFSVFFGNAIFPSLLPTLATEFHVSPLDLEWLVPGFSLTYATATLAYGILADQLGRLVVLRRLLFFASSTLVLLSVAMTSRQLVLLRALSGLGIGGIVTIALSMIGDKYEYSVQGKPMGRMFGAIIAGMGLGVSLGPILSTLLSWRWLIRIIAATFVFAVYKLGRTDAKPALQPQKPSLHEIIEEYRCVLRTLRGKRTLAFILANGVFHGGIFAWLGLLLAERYRLGPIGIGLTLVGYGIPDLILGALIGGWADRYGRRYVVPGGFFWAACCAGALALSGNQWMAGLSIAALSIGFDATHPTLSSITTSLDPKHRGQLAGMNTFANFFGMSVGALIFRELLRFSFSQALITFAVLEFGFGTAAVACFHAEIPQMSV